MAEKKKAEKKMGDTKALVVHVEKKNHDPAKLAEADEADDNEVLAMSPEDVMADRDASFNLTEFNKLTPEEQKWCVGSSEIHAGRKAMQWRRYWLVNSIAGHAMSHLTPLKKLPEQEEEIERCWADWKASSHWGKLGKAAPNIYGRKVIMSQMEKSVSSGSLKFNLREKIKNSGGPRREKVIPLLLLLQY
jgi:hypothetical protein